MSETLREKVAEIVRLAQADAIVGRGGRDTHEDYTDRILAAIREDADDPVAWMVEATHLVTIMERAAHEEAAWFNERRSPDQETAVVVPLYTAPPSVKRLREALGRAMDKARKPFTKYDDGHRCDYKVACDAVIQSARAALNETEEG